MITDLLPEYYRLHENNPVYNILRSIIIDGHEVAWMEFTGVTGEGDKRGTYTGRALYCECNFTKGVGWDVGKGGKPHNLSGPDKCIKREAALRLRHLELRQEYLGRFNIAPGDSFALHNKVEEIVLDLIKKAKAGEFLEDGNGASFWGGYFYLQTLAAIVDPSMNFWEAGKLLVKNKKISLEGAVVQDYQEPPLPEWEPFLDVKLGNWFGMASLPRFRQMPKEWRLYVMNPKGRIVCMEYLPLSFDPVFGPDVSDVENAKRMLLQLIQKEIEKENKRKKKK